MESNLPQKYNDGLFSKIRNFFSRLFGDGNGKHSEVPNESITENISNNVQSIKEEIVKEEKPKNSIDIMREENKVNREREDILLQIEKNPNLINDWSIERLLKLEKIYDEKIAQYDVEIARLKNQSG